MIAGVIQNFEFVYGLCIKMLRRQLEIEAAAPAETDFLSFRNMIRTAAEKGLLSNVQAWFDYRDLRNKTSHTYDHATAMEVYKGTRAFLENARKLINALTARDA